MGKSSSYLTPIRVGKRVFVIGVGMTKFEKPGRRENFDYPDMAKEAGQNALADAGIPYSSVEQACVGYVYGDSTSGQRAIYHSLGLTGIPIVNVNNNCATGSTALFLAGQVIKGGLANCVLALGFEKMAKGSLSASQGDIISLLAFSMKEYAFTFNGFKFQSDDIFQRFQSFLFVSKSVW